MTISKRLIAASLTLFASSALAAPVYRPVAALALGTPDRWDYVVFDAPTHRVYLAHGDRVAVIDPATPRIVGTVSGIPGGAHGVALSVATGQGFSDDGERGTAIAFDLKTLKITHRIRVEKDADAIAFDAATRHIFVLEGDADSISVIDPATDKRIAAIKTGEKIEYAVADGAGNLFVAGEEKGDLIRIDTRTNIVSAHYAAPGCVSPHGLAIDTASNRLFMGCSNAVMRVMDGRTGRAIANLPIGRGNDAVVFDPVRRRIFTADGIDGTVSIYHQDTPDAYRLVSTLKTAATARTMAVDPVSGRLFVAAADPVLPAGPDGWAAARPGTLKLLMFDPVR